MTEKSDVLDKLQEKINEVREKYATDAIQARKQGYAAMPKRTIQLKEVEDWINSLRDE